MDAAADMPQRGISKTQAMRLSNATGPITSKGILVSPCAQNPKVYTALTMRMALPAMSSAQGYAAGANTWPNINGKIIGQIKIAATTITTAANSKMNPS